MSQDVLEKAAARLGCTVVQGERHQRFYLANGGGEVALSSWVDVGKGGCFVLGPGFTYDEGQEFLAAARAARGQ